ncbi:MAG: Asp-tRNA(Asn)/Glu-tRNA(Gln) amidotransferase subunit GatC [Candidatus Sumerlaeota bacterium]|nr:Asp-tRNA(Asn)/Glu-tRNA(Gln) amidotransferase subunit GatC [Candidatus Sumerlaeota bacterium]
MSPDPKATDAALSREEVEHVALLARLELGEREIEEYASILNRILGHFKKLEELDTEGVPPTSHPAPIANVFREDAARPSLSVDEALANAPDSEAGCFKVPPVIQEY